MKFQIRQTLSDYIYLGNEITSEVIDSQIPLVRAIGEYHEFFSKTLFEGDSEISGTRALLAMHAVMIYTAAIRLSLSGHAAATYPLFRTALEAACYVFVMGLNPKLEAVWADRHLNSKTGQECRRMFSAAVKDAAKGIEARQPGSGHEEWINNCYQGAIDFGAHPNPKSIFEHLQPPEDVGDFWEFSLTGLHGSGSPELVRSLFACLDYGLVIGVVLAYCFTDPPARASSELFRLNDLKNQLEAQYRGE